ncbi:protein CYR61-like, partial [Clarias magur]
VQGECPSKCSCPSSLPACLPGISSVLDSCGCCRVCARQFNQDCSATEPCDHIKGLHCHLGAKGDPQRGLCRAEAQGRPCELDGRVYQHGEDFQPSCEHRCTCMDGVVGCMPLCPHHVSLPDWRCARPRLTTLPGRCCQEWVCDDDNTIAEDDTMLESTPHGYEKHNNLIGNELLVMATTPWDSSAGAPNNDWISSTKSNAQVPSTCFLQTTDWSTCSATCGMGVSSRVTNSNAECRLVKETRLCQTRECGNSLLASPLKVSLDGTNAGSHRGKAGISLVMVNSRVESSAVAVTGGGGGGGGAGRLCAGCGGRISDRFLLFSMERYWHTRCLKCSCCQAQLGEIGTTCYSKGGMILCRNDYIRLFGHSGACSACGQSIPASEMVMRAQGNVYHLKCFTCATCRNRLVPGDRFHYVNGTIFCEHDRPGGGMLSSHLAPLQSSTLLPDQK